MTFVGACKFDVTFVGGVCVMLNHGSKCDAVVFDAVTYEYPPVSLIIPP